MIMLRLHNRLGTFRCQAQEIGETINPLSGDHPSESGFVKSGYVSGRNIDSSNELSHHAQHAVSSFTTATDLRDVDHILS